MKTVLVSGGSRGIGAEIVRHFADNGYKAAFIYKSNDAAASELEKKTGALAIKADVSDPDEVRAAVSGAVSFLGEIDVLICNAGVSSIMLITQTSDDEWQRVINTNLSGAFYLCREVSRIMVRRHSGSIITVGSVWGRVGASCEVAYSASKAGLRGMTMALSKELAPSCVRVNCIEPGVIDTEMNSCFSNDEMNDICCEIPMNRIGKAGDVASLALFLASDNAAYITGQCIGVDGGYGL